MVQERVSHISSLSVTGLSCCYFLGHYLWTGALPWSVKKKDEPVISRLWQSLGVPADLCFSSSPSFNYDYLAVCGLQITAFNSSLIPTGIYRRAFIMATFAVRLNDAVRLTLFPLIHGCCIAYNSCFFFSLSLSRLQDQWWGNGSNWRGRELARSVLGRDSRLTLICLIHAVPCINLILSTDRNSCGFDNMGEFSNDNLVGFSRTDRRCHGIHRSFLYSYDTMTL